MKSLLIKLVLVFITLALNFGVFILSYNKLVFPHLHEAQRMENAPLIFSYVLMSFLVCAIISTLAAFYTGRQNV